MLFKEERHVTFCIPFFCSIVAEKRLGVNVCCFTSRVEAHFVTEQMNNKLTD